MIIRICEGPGCREEQLVGPNDNQPQFPDPPWLLLSEVDGGRVEHRHFCTPRCCVLFLTPPPGADNIIPFPIHDTE